jgi:hypothetical protein
MELIKSVEGVREVTPVLNWSVSEIHGEPKAVNLWAVDPESFTAMSGGLEIVEGAPLREANDLVMDTILAHATRTHVGEILPMLNREFRIAGICRPKRPTS